MVEINCKCNECVFNIRGKCTAVSVEMGIKTDYYTTSDVVCLTKKYPKR
jgi:hypothetical protein